MEEARLHHQQGTRWVSPPIQFYEYRVAQKDGDKHRMLANRVLVHTPQVRGTDKELYVAAIADLSMMDDYNDENGEGQRKVRDQLQKFVDAGLVDLTILPGDISNNDGTARKYYKRYFNIYENMLDHVPFYPIHGNHDLFEGAGGSSSVWGYDFFTMFDLPRNSSSHLLTHVGPNGSSPSGYRSVYSFDWGNTRIGAYDVPAIINVEEGSAGDDPHFQDLRPGSNQMNFITNDLSRAKGPGEWNISFFHEPLSLTEYSADPVRNHGTLIKTLRGKVDLVVNGHREVPGISTLPAGPGQPELPGIILPSGGARWRCHDPKHNCGGGCDAVRDAKYGFSIIRVTREALYVTFFDLEGRRSGEMKVTRPGPAGTPVSEWLTPLTGC